MSVPEAIDIQSPVGIDPATREPRQLDHDELKVRQQRSRRATFVKWLRKVHGWVGLWGAVLGLLFGTTGFLLNHRGGTLRISTGEPQVSQVQLPLPAHGLKSPKELGTWLKSELKIEGNLGRTKREPAHTVGWGDQKTMQPELWTVAVASPGAPRAAAMKPTCSSTVKNSYSAGGWSANPTLPRAERGAR